jgi:hypothetical protein
MAADDHPDAPAPEGSAAPAAPPDAAAESATPAPAPAEAAPDPRALQLRAAVDHFVAGNFAAARRTVSELLRGEVPPELRKQANELMRRMGLDPVALWIAVGSTVLFIVVVVLTFRR